jgi:hypothetical protein
MYDVRRLSLNHVQQLRVGHSEPQCGKLGKTRRHRFSPWGGQDQRTRLLNPSISVLHDSPKVPQVASALAPMQARRLHSSTP